MNDATATGVVYVTAVLVTCAGIVGRLHFDKKAAYALLHGNGSTVLRAVRWGSRIARWLMAVGFAAVAVCVIGFVPIGTPWMVVALGMNACLVVALLAVRRRVARFAYALASGHANSPREE